MTYNLERFCADKYLPRDWVASTFGVHDSEATFTAKEDGHGRKKGEPFKKAGIFFPYTDSEGNKQHRIRLSASGKKFCWNPADYKHQMLYGAFLLPPANSNPKEVFIVEGESCTITGRLMGLRTVGVAGAPNGWVDEFKHLPIFKAAETIYVIQEPKRAELKPEAPDAGALLVQRIAPSFPGKVRVIRLDKLPELSEEGVKDLSDLWILCKTRNPFTPAEDFNRLWHAAKLAAVVPQNDVLPVLDYRESAVADMPPEVLDGWLGEQCKKHMAGLPIAYAWPALLAAASVQVPKIGNLPLNLYVCLLGGIGSGKQPLYLEHFGCWKLESRF